MTEPIVFPPSPPQCIARQVNDQVLCRLITSNGYVVYKLFGRKLAYAWQLKIVDPKSIPMKHPKPKLSKRLALRTHLTPAQLERVTAEGNGAASKYGNDGVQSLALTRRLAAAKRKAKRLVLYTDQLGRRLYIGDRAKMNLRSDVSPLTFDKNEALHFIEGFDNIEQACRHWSTALPFASPWALFKFISTHL